MFNYYQKDGEDIYARTGKYMENSYIGEDLQQCNVLMLAFNQRWLKKSYLSSLLAYCNEKRNREKKKPTLAIILGYIN